MPFNQVDLSLPGDFTGQVRLFPLPDVVVFPGVMQGLHIFEPRYVEMMRAALASDQLITMATLKPGWENESGDDPEIYSTVCVGKIMTHSRQDDGRYNVLLAGARRARIVSEIPGDTPFRRATVEIVEEGCEDDSATVNLQSSNLVEKFRTFISLHPGFGQSTISESIETLSPGLMADLICYSASLDAPDQIQVLETSDLVARINLVTRMIEKKNEKTRRKIDSESTFPPDFSSN